MGNLKQRRRLLTSSAKQFVLTPTQFGVPNERPRYYCVAVRGGLFSSTDGDKAQLLDAVPGAPRSPAPAPLRAYLSRHLSAEAVEQLVVPEKLLAKNARYALLDAGELHASR